MVTEKQLANLIPAAKGDIRNPNGRGKGTKNLSTLIQELLNDEEFEANLLDSKKGMIAFKGAPVKAIILATRHQAINGDKDAREWLAKYGWGNKLQLSNDPDNPLIPTRELSEQELRDRLDQIVSSRQSGSDNAAVGTGQTPSQN